MGFSRPEYWRSLLQGIFPTQGSNPGLPHCRWILYQLSHKGSPKILEWAADPFSSGSSWPRNWTGVSWIAGRFFTKWARLRKALNLAYHNQINFSKVLLDQDASLFRNLSSSTRPSNPSTVQFQRAFPKKKKKKKQRAFPALFRTRTPHVTLACSSVS